VLRDVDGALLARLCIFTLAIAYAPLGWARGREAIDHHIDLRTVALMRRGSGYYTAMNHAMLEVGHAPVDEVRAFRMPTMFMVWRYLPNDHAIWLLFVAMVLMTGLMMLRLTRLAFVPPLLALVLLATGKRRVGSGWIDQFAVVELWAAPLNVGALLAWKEKRSARAAWLALAAVAVRELSAGLLIGGLIASLRTGRARVHWITVCALSAVLYFVHSGLAHPFLVAHGKGVELPLLHTGGVGALVDMMGFGLPLGVVVGPVLWIAAVTQCVRKRNELALGLLAVPLTGILIARPYWGLISLPAVLVFGSEGCVDAWSAVRARLRPQHRHHHEPAIV
jgi:hypothetical protein